MSRYQAMFQQLAVDHRIAVVPFVSLGDPSIEASLAIIQTLIDAGADALELGMPFSDPLADGPTIQAANMRGLAAGATIGPCFELLTRIRAANPKTPIGLLMYANLIFKYGIDAFYARCASIGIDSVLVADAPHEMAEPFRVAAQAHGVAPVFICPPNASDRLIQGIAAQGQGYTYLLSRAGVTGTASKAKMPLATLIDALRVHQAPPPLLGFGIAEPSQVVEAAAAGAQGVICGSVIVAMIEAHQHEPKVLHDALRHFMMNMIAASVRPSL